MCNVKLCSSLCLCSLEHTIGCCSVTRTAAAKKLGWSQLFSPQIATYFSECRQKQTGPIDIKWEKLCSFFATVLDLVRMQPNICCRSRCVFIRASCNTTRDRQILSVWTWWEGLSVSEDFWMRHLATKIVVHRSSCCSVTWQQLSENRKFIRSVLSLRQASPDTNTVSLTWKDTSLLPGIVHKDKCFYNKPYTLYRSSSGGLARQTYTWSFRETNKVLVLCLRRTRASQFKEDKCASCATRSAVVHNLLAEI